MGHHSSRIVSEEKVEFSESPFAWAWNFSKPWHHGNWTGNPCKPGSPGLHGLPGQHGKPGNHGGGNGGGHGGGHGGSNGGGQGGNHGGGHLGGGGGHGGNHGGGHGGGIGGNHGKPWQYGNPCKYVKPNNQGSQASQDSNVKNMDNLGKSANNENLGTQCAPNIKVITAILFLLARVILF